MTPWDKLIAAFNIANIITIVSVVVTMIAVGFCREVAEYVPDRNRDHQCLPFRPGRHRRHRNSQRRRAPRAYAVCPGVHKNRRSDNRYADAAAASPVLLMNEKACRASCRLSYCGYRTFSEHSRESLSQSRPRRPLIAEALHRGSGRSKA